MKLFKPEKRKTLKKKTDNFFNTVVTLYIYGAILGLISYMLATLVSKFYAFIKRFFTDSYTENLHQLPLAQLQYELLHNIAFTIVLVKAYNILMEYSDKKHINIKYTLEIAIIAPVVEIIFNYSAYKFEMLIFLGILAISMSIIYLLFYEKIRLVEKDYEDAHIQ